MLSVFFTLLAAGARHNSFTVDEPAHIAVGYSMLARGTDAFWIIPQYGNPPLLDMMEAALLYLNQPDIPLEELAGQPPSFMPLIRGLNAYLVPLERAEVVTRTPNLLFTVLLGAVVMRWSRELWGVKAGLIALAALMFDPILLAHGRLATTDVGTVTLGTAALYTAWGWTRKPTWQRALVTGILLGLTMLAKASGLIWTIAAGIMMAGRILQSRTKSQAVTLLAQSGETAGVSLLVLWAGYGFTWGPLPGFPLPLLAPVHWEGVLAQSSGSLSAATRWVFALGQRKQGSWWWYFPLAFVIKNPLALLAGLGLGQANLIRRPIIWPRSLALGFFPLLYTVLAISRGPNIGYRHMLAVHPFIYLAIGGGLARWVSNRPRRWWLVGGLGAWLAVATLQVFPHELSYFNELAGGPRHGARYLVDSNLDWGQGVKALRDYLLTHPGDKPQVAYHFTGIQPELYGVEMEALPPRPGAPPLTAPFHPLPGRYVIGADALQRGWPADPDMYAWFRNIEPTQRLAHSLFVYDVELPRLEWVSQCITPSVPLDETVVARGFGQADLRRADFDCTATWLYPTGGAQVGAYVLHRALLAQAKRGLPALLLRADQPSDPFVARHLANAHLSYAMLRYTPGWPAFAIYDQDKPPTLPTTPPVPMAGPLTFLGMATYPDKDYWDLETWWRVKEGPITRPFSIMAHLVKPDNQAMVVADGLGISPVALRAGDIIVQRHRFPAPVEKQGLELQTGAYWLDSLERWAVIGSPGGDAIRIALEVEP